MKRPYIVCLHILFQRVVLEWPSRQKLISSHEGSLQFVEALKFQYLQSWWTRDTEVLDEFGGWSFDHFQGISQVYFETMDVQKIPKDSDFFLG